MLTWDVYHLSTGAGFRNHPLYFANIWKFPRIGVPPVLIHFRLAFSNINHPFVGYPHDYGNPHDWTSGTLAVLVGHPHQLIRITSLQ